ncbi:hypothetical protein L2E82_41031 [Cichorium intybus]|uniref:Uncharacterized protein n=1 Tax=Cichorium intybus TaxID=13427 RepID=A0ACB9AM85_CICIN|nr:hypothetical protein L2E82_41031 [Cichorium intybus]
MTSSMEVEEREATNIYIPQQWSEAADTIACGVTHTPTVFICGPKNSGKSTFSHHLIHILLHRHKKVAYLDTDVGQPEFTPPGCLSLAVLDKETIRIGYDVLVDMLNHIAPSHVGNIFVSAKSKNLPSGTFWNQDTDVDTATVIEINSAYMDLRVPRGEIFYSLNASIVGLGVKGCENLPHCVGLGIVRGVDTLRDVVYIISPVPQHILEDVDVLLQGFIQIPICLLQVQGCVSPYMGSAL